MFTKNKKSLFHLLETEIKDDKATSAIKFIFNALLLPEPHAQSFSLKRRLLDRKVKNIVIPFNDYGIIIRIDNIKENLKPHSFILKPFGEISCGDLKFRICGGVKEIGINKKDHDIVSTSLTNLGYKMWTDMEEDFGYMHVTSEDWPKGIPTVIDIRDIKSTNVAHNLLPNEIDQIIDKYYAPLHESFDRLNIEISLSANETPDKADISSFWSSLLEHSDVRLSSSWVETNPENRLAKTLKKINSIELAGQNYSQQLKQTDLHGSLLLKGLTN